MSEFAAAVAVVEGGAALYRLADDVGLLKRIVNLFKRKEKLIVLGRSGTGKTNFLVSLAASAGLVEAVKATDRTVRTVEQSVVINDQPFIVFDTPGQEQHDYDRTSQIRARMTDPDSKCRVINVVSYGYHEYGTAIDPLTGSGIADMDYLTRHRELEISRLSEWVPFLADRDVSSWVLTVVTKADLWWDQRDDVLHYYENGAYDQAIRQQDPNIHHVVLPYCSVVHKFFGTAPVSGNFDDEERLRVNLQFLRKLVELG